MQSSALLDQPAATTSLTVVDPEADGPASAPPASQADTPVPEGVSPAAAPEDKSSDDDDDDNEEEHGPASGSLEKDSLDFDKATISIYVQLLPHDHHADGRPVIIGVRSHNLAPLTMTRRWSQVQPLPQTISELLTNWQAHYTAALDARTQARDAQRAKEKAKKEKRKSDAKHRQEEIKAQQAARKAKTTGGAKPKAAPAPAPAQPVEPAAAAPQSTLF